MGRLPIRDVLHRSAHVVYVLEGLSETTVAGLQAALTAYVRSSASVEFRRGLGADPTTERISEAAAQALIHVEEQPSATQLVVFARALRFGTLPTRIVVAGDRVAVSVSHAALDGGGILEYVTWLLTVASGGTGKRDERPPVTLPLVRGLRRVGLTGLRAFRASRAAGRAMNQATRQALPAGHSWDDAALWSAPVPIELLARIEALPTTEAVTPSARIISLAAAAMRRLYTGADDVPMIVPVDLRRFVDSRRVVGNFVGVASPTTLLGSDWSAEAVTRRLIDATTSGAAMVSGVYIVVRWHLLRLLRIGRRHADAPPPDVATIFVPLLSARRGPPKAAWRAGVVPAVAIAPTGTDPNSTSLTVLILGGTVHLSFWDESGLFDVARFGAALEDELRAQEGAALGAVRLGAERPAKP